MDKKVLGQILQTKSMPFSYSEIEQLMDEELEKGPDEMDTELIDLCLDILEGRTDEAEKAQSANKTKKIKFKKILLISAIIALIVAVSIPVSANVLNLDASNGAVKFFKEHFSIDFSDEKSLDLVLKLEEHGLNNVILPEVFYDQNEYKTTDFEYEEVDLDDYKVKIIVESLKNQTIAAAAFFVREDTTNFLSDQLKASSGYEFVKQLKTDSMDVLVFSNGEYSIITYTCNDICYSINISNCTFNEALKIAESIKRG